MLIRYAVIKRFEISFVDDIGANVVDLEDFAAYLKEHILVRLDVLASHVEDIEL